MSERYKALVDLTHEPDLSPNNDGDGDGEEVSGHPLIVPPHIWKNLVVKFDQIREKRPVPRIACYGSIVLYNMKGKVVSRGSLRDINEKSGGLEIKAKDVKPFDILYLQFMSPSPLALAQIKVIVMRVEYFGFKTARLGVEFMAMPAGSHEKLNKFLDDKRKEKDGFEEPEII